MDERIEQGALMMWSGPEKMMDKVAQARVRFQSKFGLEPNIVITNPVDANVDGNTLMTVMGIPVYTATFVAPGHIYIGYLEDKSIWLD
jgi:hypothetical protein